MRIKNACQLMVLVVAALLAGCSSVKPGKRYGSAPLETFKTAYVVTALGTDVAIGGYIQAALSQRSIVTSSGALADLPKESQFYVTYEDHWQWDLTMYLNSLDIQFFDPVTKQPIASGAFRQGAFHDFPDVRKTTFEVIDSIYKAK